MVGTGDFVTYKPHIAHQHYTETHHVRVHLSSLFTCERQSSVKEYEYIIEWYLNVTLINNKKKGKTIVKLLVYQLR